MPQHNPRDISANPRRREAQEDHDDDGHPMADSLSWLEQSVLLRIAVNGYVTMYQKANILPPPPGPDQRPRR